MLYSQVSVVAVELSWIYFTHTPAISFWRFIVGEVALAGSQHFSVGFDTGAGIAKHIAVQINTAGNTPELVAVATDRASHTLTIFSHVELVGCYTGTAYAVFSPCGNVGY